MLGSLLERYYGVLVPMVATLWGPRPSFWSLIGQLSSPIITMSACMYEHYVPYVYSYSNLPSNIISTPHMLFWYRLVLYVSMEYVLMNGRWTDGRVKRGMGGNDEVLRTAQCISYDMSLLKFRVPRSEAYTHTRRPRGDCHECAPGLNLLWGGREMAKNIAYRVRSCWSN